MLPRFDPTRTQHVRAVQPGLASRLIDLFLQETPPLLDALEQAIVTADMPAVRIVVDRLKGSSATLGGMLLADHCTKLGEQMVTYPGMDSTWHLTMIRMEYAHLATLLQNERDMG